MARRATSKGRPAKKAEAPLVIARVDEVLSLRLDGASRADICGYVREQEAAPSSSWAVARRGRPMSEAQIERYIQRADTIMREQAARIREGAFDDHLAMRRARYAACCVAGDNATALACLKDEAKLLNLYPAEARVLTGAGGGPIKTEARVTHDGDGLPPAEAVRMFLAGLAAQPGGGAAAIPPDGGA